MAHPRLRAFGVDRRLAAVLGIVFVAAYAAGALAPSGPAVTAWICGAAASVVSAHLLAPYEVFDKSGGLARWLAFIAAVSVVGALAMGLAAPSASGFAALAALSLAIGALLILLGGGASLIGRCLRDRRAGALISLLVALVAAAAPLWAGPWVEYFNGAKGFADLVVAVSPLTYLATMADYDYLREHWFYTHTPLAAYRFDYPGAISSSVVIVLLGGVMRMAAHRRLG